MSRRAVVYLVLMKKPGWAGRARVTRHSVNQPTLGRGECAVKISVEVPDEAFDPVLSAPDLVAAVSDVIRATTTVTP